MRDAWLGALFCSSTCKLILSALGFCKPQHQSLFLMEHGFSSSLKDKKLTYCSQKKKNQILVL
jgi:hypothetical protein